MMLGRVEEAIASLEKAVAINPSKMSGPAHLARFYLIQGDFINADKWIQHVRSNDHMDDANLLKAQFDFLQHHYQEALNDLRELEKSKDPSYRSYAFSLLTRVYAESGQYENALNALEQGSTADLVEGDLAHRADKLLDLAYIDFKRDRYEACLQDTRLALDSDRSLPRSLLAGTILSRAAFKASGKVKRELVLELRKISERTPRQELRPLYDIVHARLQGEVLFAEGNWMGMLDKFREAGRLEAPAKDREYLARGLLSAAQNTADQAKATRLRDEATAIYSVAPHKPGQIWQWALDFPPGYLADETFSFAKAALGNGKFDQNAKSLMNDYLKARLRADAGLKDVEEARRLASLPTSTKTDYQKESQYGRH